jgi:hypothetical protein
MFILSEPPLRRTIRDYISYYHEDRIHDSLEKDTPATHAVSNEPDPSANPISFLRIGGLHHRYDWQQAAEESCQTKQIIYDLSWIGVWSCGN